MSGSILDKYIGRREGTEEPITTPNTTVPVSPDNALDNPETESDAAAEDLGCFGWLRGTRDFPRMLELRKKDGDIVAIAYAYIERVEFDRSGTITLHAHGRKVVIQGRHLNAEIRPGVRLFQGIVRQRVGWVQECGNQEHATTLTVPRIVGIDS